MSARNKVMLYRSLKKQAKRAKRRQRLQAIVHAVTRVLFAPQSFLKG